MERTKKVEIVETLDDGSIRWKKVGGGSFKLGNRLIKPGQIFIARPEEIPLAFRDVVVAQDAIREHTPEPIPVVKSKYTVKPHGQSKTWFDVVNNTTGKVLNEKGIKKDVAEQLKQDLEK
jgi:hypothetical protein